MALSGAEPRLGHALGRRGGDDEQRGTGRRRQPHQSGTLTILPGTTTFNGAFSNAAGATLRLQADYSGGPASLTSAQDFTNAGLVDLNATGYAGNTDTLSVSSGTLIDTGTITSSVGGGQGGGGGATSTPSSTTRPPARSPSTSP